MIEKPTPEELRYWNKVLHDHRLGKGRGRSSKVDYVGGGEELTGAERRIVSKKAGAVKPKGAKPE